MFWFKKNEYKRIIDSLTLDVSRLEEENLTLKIENEILRNKVLEKFGGEYDK